MNSSTDGLATSAAPTSLGQRLLLAAGCVVVGSLTVWTGAPYDLPELQWLIWPAATLLIVSRSTRARFGLGLLFGTAAMAGVFRWILPTIERFSNLGDILPSVLLVAAAIAAGLWIALYFVGLGALRSRAPRAWPFLGAALFVCLEAWNPSIFPFTLGNPWWQRPWIFGSLATFGPAGISFVVVAVANCVAQAVLERPGRVVVLRHATLCTLGIAALAVSALVHQRRVASAFEAADDLFTLAIVQGNDDIYDDQALSDIRSTAPAELFYRKALLDAWKGADRPDLDAVVLPEGALGSLRVSKQIAQDIVDQTNAEVWAGAAYTDPSDGKPRNSAIRMGRDGAIIQRHDKNVLVPFGEYMPLEEWIAPLKDIQIAGRYQAGEPQQIVEHDGWGVAFLICYEAIRNGFVRSVFHSGTEPDLLVNLTYDGWFGDSDCPHQHRMLAASQAVLHGRHLVRCATTGISTVVDPAGRTVMETELTVRPMEARAGLPVADVRFVTVPKATVWTLYTRFGGSVIAASWIALVAFFAARWTVRRPEPTDSPTFGDGDAAVGG